MKCSTLSLLTILIRGLEAVTLNVGSGKTYATIGAAYKVASPGDTIYVYPGTYKEKLTISKNSITIKGSTYPSYKPSSNTAVLTYSTYASASGSDDSSATLLVTGDDFAIYNLNVTNSAGQDSQAVAVSVTGDRAGFYTTAIKSYQAVLYAHTGSAFFSKTYVEGGVDLIYGVTGQAWLRGVTIGVLKPKGTITAQGRSSSDTTGEIVLDYAKIILGAGAASGTKGTVYLGRAWGDYARVVVENSELSDIITDAGWETWSSSQSTSNIYFAEHANTDAGGPRVSWAKTLDSEVTIDSILSDYASWVDGAYLDVSAP